MSTDVPVDTPLHEAVRYSDLEQVSQALKDGYSPNQLGAYQWTPLHEACNNGDTEIVQCLLQYKGDPNMQDSLRGCTAVHYAASQEHVECLKLLLSAGADYNIKNSDGRNGVDVSVGMCRKLLQAECQNHVTHKTEQIQVNQLKDPDTESMSTLNSSCHWSDEDQYPSISVSKDFRDQDSLLHLDQIPVDSSGSISGHQRCDSCGSDGVVKFKTNQDLGKILLSFEYNSKKSTLKIRVWKVVDLLMPPPKTSMIHSIYVKSYLEPDKKKQTRRKTEDVRLDAKSLSGESVTNSSEIFKPSSFSFSKSLEYRNINPSLIATHDVVLSVCITQRYTHRSFPIATWSMPLKSAIKKVLKEKYPLKACISNAIPEHMKVYNATELEIIKSRTFGSNPSLICRSSARWEGSCQERSVSDPNLNQQTVERSRGKAPAIEIMVPEPEDVELEDALQQIVIMERQEAEGPYSSQCQNGSLLSLSDSIISNSSDDTSIEGITVEQSVQLAHVEIHVSSNQETKDDKTLQSNISSHSQDKTDWIEAVITDDTSKKSDVHINIPRPDTPSWDYYSEPIQFSSVVISDDITNDPSSARLPMATTLDLPDVHCSFKQQSKNNVFVVNVPKLSQQCHNEADE